MKVLVEVYQNTELVELMAFVKSRGMRIDGFPDNPELNFLRSSSKAQSYQEKGKHAKSAAKSRKHIDQLKQPRYHYYSSTSSTSEDEKPAYEFRKRVAKDAQKNVSQCASPTQPCKTMNNVPKPTTDNQKSVKKNGVVCTKCGSVMANEGSQSLISHANIHSNFNRFECGICGFSDKTASHIRLHINTEHNGESFIKFRDRLNEVERVVMKQLAHECFPAHINSPYSSQKDTIDTSPSKSNSNCNPQLSAMQDATRESRKVVAYLGKPNMPCQEYVLNVPTSTSFSHVNQPTIRTNKLDDCDDIKQSATSSSDGCSPIKIDFESDSDCIIIE